MVRNAIEERISLISLRQATVTETITWTFKRAMRTGVLADEVMLRTAGCPLVAYRRAIKPPAGSVLGGSQPTTPLHENSEITARNFPFLVRSSAATFDLNLNGSRRFRIIRSRIARSSFSRSRPSQ